MSGLVQQFVVILGQAFATHSGDNLVTSIPLSETHPFFLPLHQAVSGLSNNDISPSSISGLLSAVPPDAQSQLASFVSAVLKYVKNGGAPATTAESTYARFRSMVTIHTELHKLYATQKNGYEYAFLNRLVLGVCRSLVVLSASAAALATLPIREAASSRSIKDSTRQCIEKSIQVAATHMTEGEWATERNSAASVGDNMWPLANILWRLYAQRKLHTQATELSKTFSSIQPSEEKRLEARGWAVTAADLSESYYWRGRLGIVLLDMRGARYWLGRAWQYCPEDAWQQKRAILIRAVPASLLLGQLPRPGLLEQYSLQEEFGPFIHAFRTGNVVAWRQLLSSRREWLRARSIWLLLFERGEILVWRNLFRKALACYYQLNPSARKNHCPTWVFEAAAVQAFAGSGELEDGTVVIEDVICVLSSLIDQGLVLGHLAYSQRFIAMKGSDDGFGGFPPISRVTPRKVEAIT